MALRDWVPRAFMPEETPPVEVVELKADDTYAMDPGGAQFEGSLLKSLIPQHLYRPPYGYPRSHDVALLRKLGANAYIHSIISTIQFEVASTPWEIRAKDGEEGDDDEIKRITEFFRNPNGNSESWSYITRALVKDICEVDSGVLVKVFDGYGEFKQVFARDGGSFLKNPDVHGYLGNREDFIPLYYYQWNKQTGLYETIDRWSQQKENADQFKAIADQAAYFQYGFTNTAIPIPFGKREVIWIEANPQTNDVYGRPPLAVLGDTLYTLLYGASFNLDMYINNNIPDGIISMIGANQNDIQAFRQRWQANFTEKDVFDNTRKKFYTFPIVNNDAKFIPFTLTSKEMEVLEQQKWFWKIVLACFGMTQSEMGFTEDSNKATEIVQSSVFKRKAVKPLLDLLEYHINLQLMNELDPSGLYEFKYIEEDLKEDLARAQVQQLQIQMGIKSKYMVAEEMGIDVDQLKADEEEVADQEIAKQQEMMANQEDDPTNKPDTSEKAATQVKSHVVDDDLAPVDRHFHEAAQYIEKMVDSLEGDNNG